MSIIKALRESDSLLLDTHTLLWLFDGSTELRLPLVNLIQSANDMDLLSVSAISFWEIAMLQEKNRLRLAVDVVDLSNRVRVCPLSISILIDSCQIPDFKQHGDPADRMIMASAIHESAILLTRDKVLIAIAEKSSVLRAYQI